MIDLRGPVVGAKIVQAPAPTIEESLALRDPLHSPSTGAKFRVVTLPDSAATALSTFLFTDLEASTRTWERAPEAMDRWLACHDRLVTEAIVANRGRVFKHTGDGLCAAFVSAADGMRAARDIQLALAAAGEAQVGGLRARIAVHTGEARERDGDFYGPTLNRCARLLGIGHGGQVLLSGATVSVLGTAASVGDSVALVDLGPHRLRDLQQPERVWQLAAPGLERTFPPLRSLDAFVHNLPEQRSSFVGRDAEKRAVRDLVDAHRLWFRYRSADLAEDLDNLRQAGD